MESLEFQLLMYKLMASTIGNGSKPGDNTEKLIVANESINSTQFLEFMKRLTKSKPLHSFY